MAPEQLEGKETDARTDIFAFGTVVYEMTTGQNAFEGKSQASLIAKILETDPAPMSVLQPMTPPALDRLVIKGGADFDAGTPQGLFELPPEPPNLAPGEHAYASSADGERFLVSVPVTEEISAPITVVLNWRAGLKK